MVAFNEQVLLSRMRRARSSPAASSCWKACGGPTGRGHCGRSYARVHDEIRAAGEYRLYEIPMEAECLKYVPDPRRGKNMFALGMLCGIYSLDLPRWRGPAGALRLRQEGPEDHRL